MPGGRGDDRVPPRWPCAFPTARSASSVPTEGDVRHVMCQAAQGIMTAVPVRVHGLPPATLTETSCIANDDDWCQWDITWNTEPSTGWTRRLWHAVVRPSDDAALLVEGTLPPSCRSGSTRSSLRRSPMPTSVSPSDETKHGDGVLSQPSRLKRAPPGQPRRDRKGDIRGYLWGVLAAAVTSACCGWSTRP